MNQNWHGTLIRHMLLLVTACLVIGLILIAVMTHGWLPGFVQILMPMRLLNIIDEVQVVDSPQHDHALGRRRPVEDFGDAVQRCHHVRVAGQDKGGDGPAPGERQLDGQDAGSGS